MKKKKLIKGFAVYFALSILFQAIAPTLALALTNGPSQPEMESFEPIGTTDMVNPFSGDFNYNLPLMTVPGPNGGYPINIAYHAGPGMEEEATWVGLGWNINAGEINRQMRGLPDDFNGDLVTKLMYMKPNITASIGVKASVELAGLDMSKSGGSSHDGGVSLSVSLKAIWNSYKGVGVSIGKSVSKNAGEAGGFSHGISSNYSSLSGDNTITPSLSYSKKATDADKYSRNGSLSFSYSSVEGLKQLSFNFSKKKTTYTEQTTTKNGDNQGPSAMTTGRSGGAGISFSSSTYIPHSEMPQGGFSVGAAFDFGADILTFNPYFGGDAMYSQNKIKQNIIAFKGYGYMYSQNKRAGDGNDFALMDFNREKDNELVKDIPALPNAVLTNDIYFVKGQGVGGAFRPYRSDIGILHDPVITGKNVGIDLGLEVGSGVPTIKVGIDLNLSYSKSYSGPWRDVDSWSELEGPSDYEFKSENTNDPLFEPFYFRNAGDMTANFNEGNTTIQGITNPLPISIGFGLSLGDFANPAISEIEEPLADVKITKGGLNLKQITERPSRSQSMTYKTFAELGPTGVGSVFSLGTVYDVNYYPRNTPIPANPAMHSNSHIGEVTVVNPDGNRYVYGLAAYNKSQEETSFSVERGAGSNTVYSEKLVDYDTDDASKNNLKGQDNFYSQKLIPEYAHSYLLTAIVSPDYVDVTGDGLSEDDYGYYVKFNYSKLIDDYFWRSPFLIANFIEGNPAPTSIDDKAGFAYGSKEIWYLNSIETKTHIAEFTLSDRNDAIGVNNRDNGSDAGGTIGVGYLSTSRLKKLDKIDLYSKNDPNYFSGTPTPIKTVHFEYSYELCRNVINNSNTVISTTTLLPATPNVPNTGKLTLKKVWFSHLNNKKGASSPYVFDYHETNPAENPDFSTLQMDRWGNYKSTYNVDDPYVSQKWDVDGDGDVDATDDGIRNNNSSAWSLKEILMPSGGKIKIDYESDDYAFVQNKQAMQMSKIVATARKSGPTNLAISSSGEITGDYLYLLFDLERQPTSAELALGVNSLALNIAKPYVENIKTLYFKTFQELKKDQVAGAMVSDYVSGYANVDGAAPNGTFNDSDAATSGDVGKYGITSFSGKSVGYIKLANINVHDNGVTAGVDTKTNPLRKAGWQYLKLNRTDLLYPSTNNDLGDGPGADRLLQLANSVVGYFTSNIQLFAGYYNYCVINGYAKHIDITDDHPSFIRVQSPDKIKYGGGYRVKTIKVTDDWAGLPAEQNTYGQEFTYRLTDGTSSGVAEYEPLIGGDEIALRQPVRYSSDYFIVKHDNLYLEEPYCESYYPAASVGYSRVIVKGITHTENNAPSGTPITKGVQGITVSEFYTAKDFPVIITPSNLLHKKFTPDLSIPFIGNVSFENHGFSQTYNVETNDMHGKSKSITTYPYGTNLTASSTAVPVSKTEYIYKTDAEYSSSTTNHLNNEVDVLYNDAYYKTSNLGLTKEFFIDMRERSSVSMVNGGQVGIEYTPPAIVYVSFLPSVSYSEMESKMAVGMNITSRNGVLVETRQFSEGAMASTKNLMFDAATGKPLLTQVTNDFGAPVYTYEYAAQWAYDGMGASYKNVGATFQISHAGSGVATTIPSLLPLSNYLSIGDEVIVSPATGTTGHLWVTTLTASNFTLRDKTGATFTGSTGTYFMKILRSGRRNQLSVSDGKIVSLTNPVTERKFPLFKKWNDYVDVSVGLPPALVDVTDCATSKSLSFVISNGPGNRINFEIGVTPQPDLNALCGTTSCKCNEIYADFGSSTLYADYHLKKIGNIVKAYELVAGLETGNSITGVWYDKERCLKECMDDVLHADAVELSNDNSIWSYNYSDFSNNQFNSSGAVPSGTNMYVTGQRGIWRMFRTNAYQIDRKRAAATNIAKDGVYNNFVLFDWNTTISNLTWTWANEVTKYNPYGFEIENKDQLGIYSSALYGYDNSVQTAVAANASYYETVFDGFEDYQTSSPQYLLGNGHGHLNLTVSGVAPIIISTNSHSGKKAIQLNSGETAQFVSDVTTNPKFFQQKTTKSYVVSAWYKVDPATTITPTINVTGSGITGTPTVSVSPAIEGWKKVEAVFTSATFTTTPLAINFSFTAGSLVTYWDDVRIQPFQSTLKTYVYNPQTLWLVAELDNQNYATFYNYDEEGTLVQVKKETVKGVSTIKTTRSNIKKNLVP